MKAAYAQKLSSNERREQLVYSTMNRAQHCFLKLIYCFSGKESDHRRLLKEDGQEILMLAISSLEAVIGFLKNGAIEVQMLLLIKEYSERFLLLCEQISKDNRKSSYLSNLLNQRCIELSAFEGERENVFTLIGMCSCLEKGR